MAACLDDSLVVKTVRLMADKTVGLKVVWMAGLWAGMMVEPMAAAMAAQRVVRMAPQWAAMKAAPLAVKMAGWWIAL